MGVVGVGCYYQIFSVMTRPYTRLCSKFLQRSQQKPFYEFSKIITMSQQSVSEFLAELHARAKRTLVVPYSEENLVRVTYPSRKFWWWHDRKSIRPYRPQGNQCEMLHSYVWKPAAWYCTSMLWSISNYQNTVSADQYHDCRHNSNWIFYCTIFFFINGSFAFSLG